MSHVHDKIMAVSTARGGDSRERGARKGVQIRRAAAGSAGSPSARARHAARQDPEPVATQEAATESWEPSQQQLDEYRQQFAGYLESLPYSVVGVVVTAASQELLRRAQQPRQR